MPFQTIATLLPHTPAILTWSWLLPLSASDDSCVLVVISADQDPVTRSDANPDDLVVDTVSVWDKHVAHRNLQIIGLQIGGDARARAPKGGVEIDLHNPYDHPDFFLVEIDRGTLPKGASVDVVLPDAASMDPATHRVLIAGRSRVRARVAVVLPAAVKPGAAFRFSVIQRWRERIMGGSTYEVRVPPVVIRIGGTDPAGLLIDLIARSGTEGGNADSQVDGFHAPQDLLDVDLRLRIQVGLGGKPSSRCHGRQVGIDRLFVQGGRALPRLDLPSVLVLPRERPWAASGTGWGGGLVPPSER